MDGVTMSGETVDFETAFEALTGYRPLRWQRRLYRRLYDGTPPSRVELPTGLGKTSVVVAWLIALANTNQAGAVRRLPRRLVYVINRRTVVDQVTALVERLRERLRVPESAGPGLVVTAQAIADRLRRLAAFGGDGEPLAVSTLRGELADNEEWKRDPARPAVVVGTIDMIGSRLLFRGYGDGPYWRPHHAGLLGQDALLVHDEAHLTPAFSATLGQLAALHVRQDGLPPFVVMELSATHRPDGESEPAVFRLEPEDEQDAFVAARLDAPKTLRLHRTDGSPAEAIARLALEHERTSAKVVVYVESPGMALEVQKRLGVGNRSALLTGTIRGYERDRLVREDPIYRAFLSPQTGAAQTLYLVSTSAGEVGADLYADHMVCEATTLDRLIQRLGRVNRHGGPLEARVDVVALDNVRHGLGEEFRRAVNTTLNLLRAWGAGRDTGVSVSPRALDSRLRNVPGPQIREAFSPAGAASRVTDILIDDWSMTSLDIRDLGCPPVGPYLRGLDPDPPHVFLAWRQEVGEFAARQTRQRTINAWFSVCPIRSWERLQETPSRARRSLAQLAERSPAAQVVLIDSDGTAKLSPLSDLLKADPTAIEYATVVLPPDVGGLNERGMLDGSALARDGLDVAEARGGIRRMLAGPDGQEQPLVPAGGSIAPGMSEIERLTVENGDGEAAAELVLYAERLPAPERARFERHLDDHLGDVAALAGAVADSLNLPVVLRQALVTAGRWHDAGKARRLWQRYAGARPGDRPLAKSRRYGSPEDLGGYRHEFGSLLDAALDAELARFAERDLVLHLVAAHHGWARPHFTVDAYDYEGPADLFDAQASIPLSRRNGQACAEAARRFGRLQRRFGWWGLAWLEALLRCADAEASRPGSLPAWPTVR